MTIKKSNIYQQVKNNSVAIVSLLTALSGFFYNTHQNQENEVHLNMRAAAFEVLKDLGELQTVVNYAHYESNNPRGNPIEGWKYVVRVRDLSRLLPDSAMNQSEHLYQVWEQDWEKLENDLASERQISAQIALVRTQVLSTIDALR